MAQTGIKRRTRARADSELANISSAEQRRSAEVIVGVDDASLWDGPAEAAEITAMTNS